MRDNDEPVKTIKRIAGFSVVFLVLSLAHAQSFVNLNFESANVPASGLEPYGTFVPITSALPGWTAYLGPQQITQVGYNSPTLGTATVSLIGPTWNSSDTSTYLAGIIDGNYSVDLQTGVGPPSYTGGENVSIAQNGTVSSTAQSIQFEAFELTPLTVSFNGNFLSPVALSSGTSPDGLPYTLYGANIAPWAGVYGELEFTADFNGSFNNVVLDDIAFSPNAVPEPSIVALTAIGGILFGARKCFARRGCL